MIKRVIYTNQFRRDAKKVIKQGKNFVELEGVVENLVYGKSLELKYRDHTLSGNWSGYRECHIRPDWLLIYRVDSINVTLYRTGTHSELF